MVLVDKKDMCHKYAKGLLPFHLDTFKKFDTNDADYASVQYSNVTPLLGNVVTVLNSVPLRWATNY